MGSSLVLADLLASSPKVFLVLGLSPKTDISSIKEGISTLGAWFAELNYPCLVQRPRVSKVNTGGWSDLKRYVFETTDKAVNSLIAEIARLKIELFNKNVSRIDQAIGPEQLDARTILTSHGAVVPHCHRRNANPVDTLPRSAVHGFGAGAASSSTGPARTAVNQKLPHVIPRS